MLFSLDTMSLFVVTSVVLGLAPGPDNIFILTQSALTGRKTGLIVTLGLCTGILIHTMLVAVGVSVIFRTSEIAFTLLKIAGASYLAYLAWQAFKAKASDLEEGEAKASRLKWHRLYMRGIIMNVTNPKVAIFFLAFLPQFADPLRGSMTLQLLLLGIVFDIVTLFVFSLIALGAGYLGEWLKKRRIAQLAINYVAGTIFLALALRLVSTKFSKT
ncbi:LysE family translocator [uncultured Cohaesibacter sp.]|uniref:LysE family translocator n=1 Tax=uncultured Cohaesibacter sp. TaxID=1002546 RepID=UPI002AA6C845|nr:LysE family translocator [uncultured Cohaesibacter sp.]